MLTLGVDDDTGVILEVEEDTVATAPRLALTDDDRGVNLLTKIGLTLLDSSHNHVCLHFQPTYIFHHFGREEVSEVEYL